MKTTIIKTRKFNKEDYTFILHEPDYKGELGCLGFLLDKYITVETPSNDFGYCDIVLFNSKDEPYTLYRYLQPWVLKAIKKEYLKLKAIYM